MRRALFLLVVLAVTVAACGGSGDEADTPSVGPTAGPSDNSPAPDTAMPNPVGDPTDTAPPPVTGSLPPPPPSDAPSGPQIVREIVARGVARVGVLPRDVPPFFYFDPDQNQHDGFEATIARLLIEQTIGSIEIEFVPLTGAHRFAALDRAEVDFVVRMTAVTPDRLTMANFTEPYLLAGVAAMVPIGSDIEEIGDLANSRLAVPEGSVMRVLVGDKFKELGFPYSSVQTGADRTPWDAVVAGDADGYIGSWSQGVTRAQTEGDVRVIPIVFNEGIAVVTALEEDEWAAILSDRLGMMIESGVWAAEFERSFGFAPPWTPDEMSPGED